MSAWPDQYQPDPAPEALPEYLLAALGHTLRAAGSRPRRLIAGLSGGSDSTALLLALAKVAHRLPAGLAAVHVNHGTHARADQWQQYCADLCQRLELPLQILKVQPDPHSGRGPEAEWRHQRYEALAEHLSSGDVFITAHHLEDQAETLLLKLMRGSGLPGLAAMPAWRRLGDAFLLRPLLAVSGATLRAYAQEQGAAWIEDPANENPDFDRVFLRRSVLPLLQQRWPAASRLLARSAAQAREALELNETWARRLLAQARGPQGQLCLPALPGREPALLKAVLRHWLGSLGARPLPGARLQELCRQLVTARDDAAIEVNWSGHCLRLYNDCLWLCEQSLPAPLPERAWPPSHALALGPAAGRLSLHPAPADKEDQTSGWLVRARVGGERIQVRGRHIEVSEWLRAKRLPPWLRSVVPLLCNPQQEVLAVGDQLLSDGFLAWLKAHDCQLRWRPAHPLLASWQSAQQPPPKSVETPTALS